MRKVGGALVYVGLFFADVELGGFVFCYDDRWAFFDEVAILWYCIVVFSVDDDFASRAEVGGGDAFRAYDADLLGWYADIAFVGGLLFG